MRHRGVIRFSDIVSQCFLHKTVSLRAANFHSTILPRTQSSVKSRFNPHTPSAKNLLLQSQLKAQLQEKEIIGNCEMRFSHSVALLTLN